MTGNQTGRLWLLWLCVQLVEHSLIQACSLRRRAASSGDDESAEFMIGFIEEEKALQMMMLLTSTALPHDLMLYVSVFGFCSFPLFLTKHAWLVMGTLFRSSISHLSLYHRHVVGGCICARGQPSTCYDALSVFPLLFIPFPPNPS